MSAGAEATVSAAWCAILGVDEAAADQNFFDLGGDSLMAIMFIEKVESGLDIEFPMRTLLMDGEYRSVLAECVELSGRAQD
ncbi:acyl carrier protein [Actinoplanes couchii]|uniref:Carrier domain-containing protein n=1 Tax=Actinoplanes couchii TaxID=403638 RepID=A0ABQ3XBZ8_9ACTN|nr:acyl carrier protein [Actinoplanes couchii]MDR6323405.1 acyl carrier protein [Actinoplanes couchii]GID55920.1 hypothetical protein Aco03nite_043240 [Actinoplanes couchii]